MFKAEKTICHAKAAIDAHTHPAGPEPYKPEHGELLYPVYIRKPDNPLRPMPSA